MIDANEKTAEVFEVIADIAGGLAKRTGPLGIGALGVAAIADAVAGAIRSRGATVDEIVAGIITPRELNFPWDSAAPNQAQRAEGTAGCMGERQARAQEAREGTG